MPFGITSFQKVPWQAWRPLPVSTPTPCRHCLTAAGRAGSPQLAAELPGAGVGVDGSGSPVPLAGHLVSEAPEFWGDGGPWRGVCSARMLKVRGPRFRFWAASQVPALSLSLVRRRVTVRGAVNARCPPQGAGWCSRQRAHRLRWRSCSVRHCRVVLSSEQHRGGEV